MDNDNKNDESLESVPQDSPTSNEPEAPAELSSEPVESSPTAEAEPAEPSKESKKSKKPLIFAIILAVILVPLGIFGSVRLISSRNSESHPEGDDLGGSEPSEGPIDHDAILTYHISGNGLEDFDLAFLQIENKPENKVYSPLSIKCALGMLEEGTNGESKAQISSVIGAYSPKKYVNSQNMSFANALFVNSTLNIPIETAYTSTLQNKFGAEVIHDSFATPNALNSWVSNKTFNLIDKMFEDVSGSPFVLLNALAVDMEWQHKLQRPVSSDDNWQAGHRSMASYKVRYDHINYSKYVGDIWGDESFRGIDFDNAALQAKSAEIAAVANRYDIVKELGADNMHQTIKAAYEEWIADDDEWGNKASWAEEWQQTHGKEANGDNIADLFMQELGNGGLGDISSSTDFSFYVNDDVKVFAKDLKEYNGTTLQYVGIMPKEQALTDYIKGLKATDLNAIVGNLNPIALSSFKDGVITEITGFIPFFNFDYELGLKSDLRRLGITDVFQSDGTADLSGLTSLKNPPVYIDDARHKANIDFSNDGIKAAAVTTIEGGLGAAGFGFTYEFDVPVEKIDLTFDKPYLFLIRDKSSGEVWFTGTVYRPVEK